MHQTGMEALLTNVKTPLLNKSSLVIDCGATHHMFHNKEVFMKLDLSLNRKITTSDPNSNLVCKSHVTVEIMINNKIFVLEDCLYVPDLTKNLVSLLDLCHKPITITRNNSSFQLSQNNSTILSGQIINNIMIVTFNQAVSLLTKQSHDDPWHHD
ncbi:hypothetical protein O181_088637 [Austropuccinia psidii MF-1]|uniref:Retrovirus-related Pol polyprotein from transposon TNT 1-94-like beta-barrel domain-containing protein n=1 Tax=Austropuccinia psidii MF-1 TaxID=1389203 RepID=A0A9Q3IRW7_9BASI|nr:hypothetical protein [Austropuccinia psidii MF-1]